jgi:integral membrane protein (TIGR01906 family)
MQTPAWLTAVAHIALILAIPILLVATPLYVYISPGFVRHEYRLSHIPPSERFGPQERLRLSDPILHYLRGRISADRMAATRTDEGQIALLPEEVQHLVDVKRVTDGFFVAHQIALTVGVLALAALWLSPRRALIPAALRQGVWLTGGLILFILAFALIDFDLFFTRFHQIFFTAGSWVFYADDTLIQLYPLPFWVDAVWKVAVTILVEAVLTLLAARWLGYSAWLEAG